MSSINTVSNLTSWYIQNATKVHRTEGQESKVKQIRQEPDSYQSNLSLSQNNPNASFVSPLSSLVEDGTLTQDQLTAIDEAFKNSAVSSSKGVYTKTQTNPITSLVANGTITQKQADAIKEAFRAHKPQQPPKQDSAMESQIDSLVEAGTISKDQADAVKEALKQVPPPKPPAEEQLDSLVEDGTLTEEQLNTVISTFLKSLQNNNTQNSSSSTTETSDTNTDPISSLVSAGTITQKQADAIMDILDKTKPAEPPKSPFEDILGSLVEDGTLTEDQLFSIEASLQPIRN